MKKVVRIKESELVNLIDKIITETTRKQKISEGIRKLTAKKVIKENEDFDSLEKKAFQIAKSDKMDKFTDEILNNLSPDSIRQLKSNLMQLNETSLYENDFNTFSNIVNKLQSDLNENNATTSLKTMVGNLLSRFGRLNIAFLGTLPIIINHVVNELGITPETLSRGEGQLSMVASLIVGGILWRLGDKLRGKEGVI
jgi:hypothetical protein